MLGPNSVPKSIVFSYRNFDPQTTLAANYLSANALNSVDPSSVDKETIDKVTTIASHYIDSIEKKSLADINRVIGEKYDNLALTAKRQGKDIRDIILAEAGQSIMKEIKFELKTQKDRIDKAV
jgi:hypothetical protein